MFLGTEIVGRGVDLGDKLEVGLVTKRQVTDQQLIEWQQHVIDWKYVEWQQQVTEWRCIDWQEKRTDWKLTEWKEKVHYWKCVEWQEQNSVHPDLTHRFQPRFGYPKC